MNEDYKKIFDLNGKVAIVTGGAGVLGKSFCKGLAQHGANIAIVDLLQKQTQDLAMELEVLYGIKARAYAFDVANEHSVRKMVEVVVSDFGEINVLLNNVAAKSKDLNAFFAPFEEYKLDQWREIMSVNLDAMFLVAQSVGRQMLAQKKGGSIIQVASIYGFMSPDHRIYEGSKYLGMQINTPAVYMASKSAIIGLTKYLSTYWANKNIRVNTLSPGGVESGQNEIFKNQYSARVPLNRMAQPSEMVGALVFLASDASSYLTGQNIIVDGGLSAW